MTKLVFHLGDMKTGSTAIQTALSSRAWTCNSARLAYPSGHRVSHILFAQSLSGRGVDRSQTRRLVEEILTELAKAPADVAVISAEQFENVEPEVLKATIEDHMPEYMADARFISYVRPHADRFASTYAERVKTGLFLGTLEALQKILHKRKTFVYAPRFRKWREVFGDAFTLRPMIRETLFRQDVVADFLKFALQTEDFTLSETPDSNESLSLENLAIVRELHLRMTEGRKRPEDYISTVGRALARRMNESAFRSGTKVRIHRDLAETIRRQYADDAAALDREFFDGSPMMEALNAAPAKAVETAQSLRIEDHYTPREQFLIDTFLDQAAVLIKADPVFLSGRLRDAHRSKVIAEHEPLEEKGAAKSRRGPGGKKVAKEGPGGGGVAGGKGAGAKLAVRKGKAKRGNLATARQTNDA